MMRRLANQSRKDAYKSNRDYQTLHTRRGQRLTPTNGAARIVFSANLLPDATGLICWGGYMAAAESVTINVDLIVGKAIERLDISLDGLWRRVGGVFSAEVQGKVVASLALEWTGPAVDVWGLGMGRPQMPGGQDFPDAYVSNIKRAHMVPETFYLPHAAAIDVEIASDVSVGYRAAEGPLIQLKKCSYCGRLLPIDPNRLGALAFHKHNAKATNHQNECRVCKKWRINDSFNPKRTTDQLHESSSITRERKLLLREPEILQAIKERTGAGLKSQVWNRFQRKCFRCRIDVALDNFQLDHTRPLAYLWPIDEYATCLCANCNNEKKEKFPVDFYTDAELRRLSSITGLPLSELRKKELNQVELDRILADLATFAREWDPRTFAATARKIKELAPRIDLFERLRALSPKEHARLQKELQERPPAIEDDDE